MRLPPPCLLFSVIFIVPSLVICGTEPYQSPGPDNGKLPVLSVAECDKLRIQKDNKAALNCYDKIRERTPGDFHANLSYALMLGATGERERALVIYEYLLGIQPSNPIVLNNLAYGLAAAGRDLARALALAEEARRQDATNEQIADTLAFVYLKSNRPDEAIRILRDLTEKSADTVLFRYRLAVALQAKGDCKQAKRELDIGLALGPTDKEERAIRRVIAQLPEPCRSEATELPARYSRPNATALLQRAAEALRGASKDEVYAKRLVLKAVAPGSSDLDPGWLGQAYIYLGYIEDRAGKREEARSWYKKALAVKDAPAGIVQTAEFGLNQPLTWLRHLDEGTTAPIGAQRWLTVGRGYVTLSAPPTGLSMAQALSEEERSENFDILWNAIDKTYADFKLKSIDWAEVRQRYQRRLSTISDAQGFYDLMFEMVGELRDTHSWIQGYQPAAISNETGLQVDLLEGKPIVVAVRPEADGAAEDVTLGSEILTVDGLEIPEKIGHLRRYLGGASSDRWFKRQACRRLLAGERGTTALVKLRSPAGSIRTVSLQRQFRNTPLPSRKYPFQLTRQRFVHYSRHPSGFGFIWIPSFVEKGEIAREFDQALEALKDAPGLIIDVRDNYGGSGISQAHIIGRFIQSRTPVAISYIKTGPRHDDIRKQEAQFSPSGTWQYTRPVVLLVNDATGSAADLFTCYFRSTGRVVTIGSTTHGNLSGVAAHIVLPCGMIVRTSNGYVADAKDRPIEGNGNKPDIVVTPTVQDFLQGRDPELEEAIVVLKRG